MPELQMKCASVGANIFAGRMSVYRNNIQGFAMRPAVRRDGVFCGNSANGLASEKPVEATGTASRVHIADEARS
jgi:hypothetical protein